MLLGCVWVILGFFCETFYFNVRIVKRFLSIRPHEYKRWTSLKTEFCWWQNKNSFFQNFVVKIVNMYNNEENRLNK